MVVNTNARVPYGMDFLEEIVAVHWRGGVYLVINLTATSATYSSESVADPVVTYKLEKPLSLVDTKQSYIRQSSPGTETDEYIYLAWWGAASPVPDASNVNNAVGSRNYRYGGQFAQSCYLPNIWYLPDGSSITFPGSAYYGANVLGYFPSPDKRDAFIAAFNTFFGAHPAATVSYYYAPDGTVVDLYPLYAVPLQGKTVTITTESDGSASSQLTAAYLIYVPTGTNTITMTVTTDGLSGGSDIVGSLYPQSLNPKNLSQVGGDTLDSASATGTAGTTVYTITVDANAQTVTVTGAAPGGGGGPS